MSALVFDWDGTLFDSMPVKQKNFVEVFQKQLESRTEALTALHNKFTGLPRRQLFGRVYESLLGSELSEDLFNKMDQSYTALNVEGLRSAKLFPDVLPTFNKARALGLRCMISSSTPQVELNILVEPFMSDLQPDEVLGSSGLSIKGRPHFQFLMTKYNFEKENLIFVGDDEMDGELASKSDILFFRILRGSLLKDGKPGEGTLSNLTEIFNHV